MTDYALERTFAQKAHAGLADLHALDHVDFDAVKAVAILSDIETAAQPVHARGVAKACALCSAYLDEVGASNGFVHAFFGLKKLITQYSDGLVEIDPDFAVVLNGGDTAKEMPSSAAPGGAPDAGEIVTPLIRFCDTQSQKNALGFLSQFGQNPAARLQSSQPRIDFDRALQSISTSALRAARLRSKTVSFSYVSDVETLSRKTAILLQSALERVCETVVAFGVTTETKQVSLNVADTGASMTCTVQWLGSPMGEVHMHRLRRAVLPSAQHGGRLKLNKGASPCGLQTLTLTWPVQSTPPIATVPAASILDPLIGATA